MLTWAALGSSPQHAALTLSAHAAPQCCAATTGRRAGAKYGSYPLHRPYCHEMALRILLAAIEAHSNRCKRHIVPVSCFTLALGRCPSITRVAPMNTCPGGMESKAHMLAAIQAHAQSLQAPHCAHGRACIWPPQLLFHLALQATGGLVQAPHHTGEYLLAASLLSCQTMNLQ